VKLLLYSHYFAPSVGGVETITMSLASGLADIRNAEGRPEFEVTVATQTMAGQFEDSALAFRIVRCPESSELRRIIRDSDVVNIAGPALEPLFWSWSMGKPFVVEHHGYQAICPNGLLLLHPEMTRCPGHFQAQHYVKCLKCNAANQGGVASLGSLCRTFPRRWLSRRATANVAISPHVMRRLAFPRSSTSFYGIEDPLTGAESEGVVLPTKESFCFAYVGRLVEEKGLPLLLEAAKQLRNEGFRFVLRFVGDGPERKKLQDSAISLDLLDGVEFTGFLRGAALAKCLRSVDAVVMPSIWEETAGLAAIEHMMLGRMVIAADIGGLGEVVGEAGLKFEPGNAQALAVCMRDVLRNPSLIAEIGATARARALELFQRHRMLNEHAEIYRQAFAQGNAAGQA
jgi:glycosyltransferase involved in cell wall biosynthesis